MGTNHSKRHAEKKADAAPELKAVNKIAEDAPSAEAGVEACVSEESLLDVEVLGPRPLKEEHSPVKPAQTPKEPSPALDTSPVKAPAEPKEAQSPVKNDNFLCTLCNIKLHSAGEMSTHLASDWHRRAALSRLFYVPMPPGPKQRMIYPKEAFHRLAQSPLVLNAPEVNLHVEEIRRAPPQPREAPKEKEESKSRSKLPLLERPIAAVKPRKEEKPQEKPTSYSQAVDPAARLQPQASPENKENRTKPKTGDAKSPRKRQQPEQLSKKELEDGELDEEEPPKKPLWITDPVTIGRRQKDIDKAKDSDVYARYAWAIPRPERHKGIHPRTPNKYDNCSRRSWDAQMRLWKKSLHVWAGHVEGGESPSPEPTPTVPKA